MTDYLFLTTILRDYMPGDDHPWQAEFDWLDQHHAARLWELATSIRTHGIRQPILLGNDGRVWDGHHRLRIAQVLGIATIPVEVIPTP